MKTSTRKFLAFVVVLLGIVLLIGGIVTGKHGAIVVGIIVSGVAAQHYISLRSKDANSITH
jgi:hypothetical protein